MARIFTTPEAEQTAKAYLHDLTLAAGLRSKSQRASQQSFTQDFVKHATILCDELVNREFANVDSSINWIEGRRFDADLSGTRHSWKKYKHEGVAKCLVYMAELLNIYWDDTVRTPYEIEEFKKTYLGSTVYKYGRYISAIKDKSGKSRNKATSGPSVANAAAGGTGNVGQANAAQQPKSGYKQSGPQSSNVRDLRDLDGVSAGTPGNKCFAGGSFIYKIVGDKTGSNTPNVFIKPLSSSGAVGNTNKIFISSGNGYTDCTCYFDDPNDAQAFLDKINQNNRVPVNVNNLRVVKLKADTNGYFLVGTEFGVVAISAKTLNEALNEAMNEEVERPVDWEKATEGYTKKELDELHTWMRRG
jgi:hypothetical protein